MSNNEIAIVLGVGLGLVGLVAFAIIVAGLATQIPIPG